MAFRAAKNRRLLKAHNHAILRGAAFELDRIEPKAKKLHGKEREEKLKALTQLRVLLDLEAQT